MKNFFIILLLSSLISFVDISAHRDQKEFITKKIIVNLHGIKILKI